MSANISSNMCMYAATLIKAGAMTHAIAGSFSGTGHEILVARGKLLELLRPDANSGKLVSVATQEIFAVIRALVPFRLTGSLPRTCDFNNHQCSNTNMSTITS